MTDFIKDACLSLENTSTRITKLIMSQEYSLDPANISQSFFEMIKK